MSPTKHLVIPSPTYGDPAGFAQNVLKYTVKSAPVTEKTLKTICPALLPHVKGAGLVYICNPNNPTSTINSAQGDQGLRSRRSRRLRDDGDPDRRGLLRLRQRPELPDRDSGRARDARRARGADLLEGLRHGRRARSATRLATSPP